jgi:hypothetical protein
MTLIGLSVVALTGTTGFVAYEAGTKSGVQQAFYCNAIHGRGYVTALRAIRTGDAEMGIRSLEMSLNAGVILMAPDEILEDRTKKSVEATLQEIKAYRAAYPWNGNPELNARVEKILSGIENK